jgi:CheY-like chemotaxis protein
VGSPWREVSDRTRYRDPLFRMALPDDPPRILIVADVATNIQIVALLHSIGRFETRFACSANAALSVAHCFLPNIALMSTDLPDLASYRLASALRWDSKFPALRLIALTDDIPGTDRGRTLAAGFEQYLSLPVQSAALKSALVPRVGHPGGSHFRDTRRLRSK